MKIIKKLSTRNYLFLASGLQILVILAMLISTNLPLYFGEEIKLQTQPIDPRSLFRGNFVRLNYNLSPIKTNIDFKKGDKIYISLKQKDGFSVADKAFVNIPDKKYIQCRATYRDDKNYMGFKCANIDAFFTNKENALKIEKDLADGGVATIMLFNGKMTIKNISKNL
jgi:uncharacterized membrane-anchored protein